jgi:CIC family chloride channel protein
MARPPRQTDRVRLAAAKALRRLGKLFVRSDRLLTMLAFVIGVVTGLGAIGFSHLIEIVSEFYFGVARGQFGGGDRAFWLLPLLPMSGALLVGVITSVLAPEAEGHGVPEVMDAMARKGGRIRPRVAGAKAVASALTIGSGGAAGTEGPIIQIGAAIGSGVGQWLRLSLADIRVLIACGAAAGIASIFNAPIAGVLFAVEVLLRDVSLRSFVPIIIAAVMSCTVTQAFKGNAEAIFPVPAQFTAAGGEPYHFTVPEFGNYLVLGVVCGLVAVSFVKLLYLSEDLFRRLPVHRILRPVVGAALLGGLVLVSIPLTQGMIPSEPSLVGADHAARAQPPAVMGNGYPVIQQTLEPTAYKAETSWSLRVLLVLLVAKILATCLTLGSGGSGGVFAPSLFIGATTGGAFGLLVREMPWFSSISPGGYALVGMAAVVAASIHAPLTATLILFELTRDYKVIVPIMLAAVSGLAVAQWIEPASIYTLKLLRRGVRLGSTDARLLQRLSVRDVPRVRAPIVSPMDPVDSLIRVMRTTTANDFLVVNEDGAPVGMVLGDDLRTMLLESEAMPLLTVSDIVRDDYPSVQLDETLDVVLDKFAGKPMHSMPVIDSAHPDRVSELITRTAVMNRYHQLLAAVSSGKPT